MNSQDQKLIMVIDDDEGIRDVLCEALELENFQTLKAPHGQDALVQLSQASTLPNLILLDLMMPVMNGWQFGDVMKEHETFKNIPILILSACTEKAFSIVSVGQMEKPVRIEDLLSTIRKFV